MSRRALRPLAGFAAAVALCGGAACRGPAAPAERFPGAPVVLISIDTLRSDRLPLYGYRQVATPAIDALGRAGVVFDRVYAQVPLTLPSHLTLLTGLLPGEHGVRDNVGYPFDPARQPFLPLLLKAHGYATGGAVSAYVLRGATGLGPGFDFYQSDVEGGGTTTLGRAQRAGTATLAATREWLRTAAARGPFFLFFHLYEPHSPYEPPAPFASRYADKYDGEVATADAAVGELVDELKRLGIYERALVVLLSDHGEALGEHGEKEHGILLYREALQVPLLIKLPGGARAGERISTPAALLDVAPTLLRRVGIEPPAAMRGLDLLAPTTVPPATRPIYAETFYPRIHFGWSELESLVDGDRHYIHGPDPELYDLARDPAELRNLRADERRAAAALREALRAFERPLAAPAAADAETARQLAALGYLAGTAPAGEGPRADPKRQIASVTELAETLQLAEAGRADEVVPRLTALAAANPLMLDAWAHLGEALQRLGRDEEALAAFGNAMRLSQGTGYIAVATGTSLLRLGRLDEAAAHARLGLATSPGSAHLLLVEIALARGDLASAESEARAARAPASDALQAQVLLAQVLERQGRLDEARREIDAATQAAAEHPGAPVRGLQMVRGDILSRRGPAAEALRAYEAEIATFPDTYAAYSKLAVLLTAEGRPAEAGAALHRLLDRNPGAVAAYAEAIRTLRRLGDVAGANAVYGEARRRLARPDQLDAQLHTELR